MEYVIISLAALVVFAGILVLAHYEIRRIEDVNKEVFEEKLKEVYRGDSNFRD